MSHTTEHTDSLENTNVLEPRVYEFSYLLVPSLSEEDLDSEIQAMNQLITQLGGSHIASDHPQLIDLAYDMTRVIENKNYKFSQGYFGWFKFELAPSQLAEIKTALEKNLNIIRFLLITTVRDNTVFSKKLSYKSTRRITEGEADEALVADSEEPTTPSVVDLNLETGEETASGDTIEAQG